MSCPFCHSQRVSCPTTPRGEHMAIKSGPATCLNCGAHQEAIGPSGKLYGWVEPKRKED